MSRRLCESRARYVRVVSAPGGGGDGQSSSRMPRIVGPCYTTASIARTLHLTTDDVQRMAEAGDLLALPTADGHTVYPSFQLDHGVIVEHLGDVLRTLHPGIDDPWAWALWLTGHPSSPTPGFTPPSRVEQLRAGEGHAVLLAAEHTAHAWRS